MPTYFLDSSALVKRYREEAGTARVLELLDGSNRIAISRLAQVEVTAAIIRRGRATGMSALALDEALAVLEHEVGESFEVLELTDTVMARAVELARTHALRAADAIQLASAVAVRGEAPAHEFFLVGSDLELNAAAIKEGLSVLNPTQS